MIKGYNTLYNTLGIGNPKPPRKNCHTSADMADDRNIGSGDLYPHVGEAPSAYWCDEWKQKREEGLKRLKEEANKEYGYGEERPLLVFSEDPIADPANYKPIAGGLITLGPNLRNSF